MNRMAAMVVIILSTSIIPIGYTAASAAHRTTPAAQPCHAFNLSAATSWNGAAGSRIGAVTIVNRGTAACTLQGRPIIRFQDSRGSLLSVANVPEPGFQARRVLVRPHGHAGSSMRWSNWCGTQPKLPLTLIVTLPGNGGIFSLRVAREAPRIRVPLDPPPCLNPTHRQSVLYVRPFTAGG